MITDHKLIGIEFKYKGDYIIQKYYDYLLLSGHILTCLDNVGH